MPTKVEAPKPETKPKEEKTSDTAWWIITRSLDQLDKEYERLVDRDK